MNKQIAFFSGCCEETLEDEINEFLEEVELVDIQHTITSTEEIDSERHHILIVFSPRIDS